MRFVDDCRLVFSNVRRVYARLAICSMKKDDFDGDGEKKKAKKPTENV